MFQVPKQIWVQVCRIPRPR